MQPLLDKVYDNPNALKPYSKMNYYDLDAKFVHKFSDRDKLTAVVYWGKDVSDASPSDSYKIYKGDDNDNSDYLLIKHSTINHWDNVMGSAYWTHLFNNSFSLNVNANISHYLYYLKLSLLERTEKEIKEDSYASFNSEINEASLSTDFRLKRESKHDIRWGIKGAYQWMLPQVDTYSYILQGEARWWKLQWRFHFRWWDFIQRYRHLCQAWQLASLLQQHLLWPAFQWHAT